MSSSSATRCLLLLSLCLAGCAGPSAVTEVIAHRGSSATAPENTLVAFELGHEQGADWFELDCTLSSDGQVVVIHDDDLERTTDGEGLVWEHSLEALKKLDAGTWKDPRYAGERVPTLGEALDLGGKRIGVYVEVKARDPEDELNAHVKDFREAKTPAELLERHPESTARNRALVEAVVADIRAHPVDRVVVQSFSPIVCALVAEAAPDLTLELLGYDDAKDPAMWEGALEWSRRLKISGFNTSNRSLTEERLAEIKSRGLSVAIYTVNEPEDMRRLARWGVDRIITDRPDVCLQVLRDLGKR